MSKATAHRLLTRLERLEIVERDPLSRRYRVGRRLRELGRSQGLGIELDPRKVAWPYMEALRNACGETVALHRLDGSEHIEIEVCEGLGEIRRAAMIGRRIAYPVGASWKVLAAMAPTRMPGLDAAPSRKKDRHGLPTERELAQCRRLGYAVAHAALVQGLTSMAAPIFDHRNELWGTLSISGPTFRFTPSRTEELGALLLEATQAITRGLGPGGDAPRAAASAPRKRPARALKAPGHRRRAAA